MIILLFFCLFLLILLGGGLYAYRIAFFSPKENREKIPSISGHQYDPYREQIGVLFRALGDRPCEFVTIFSQDGLQLSGRYYHLQDGAPLDIAFHGYRSSPLSDFTGGASLSFELNHNLLLVDQRAHGKSQGRSIAFGVQERWDVLSWVDYALDRFGTVSKILLYGISMGAATVLMASQLDLPENVRGIIADCPYSTPKAILCQEAKKQGLPPFLAWPFLRLGARIYGGFNIAEASPLAAVKETKVPILLIHGEEDGFVPCSMSREIQQANPEMIQLHTFPNADHGLSFLEDTPRYRQTVTAFLSQVL